MFFPSVGLVFLTGDSVSSLLGLGIVLCQQRPPTWVCKLSLQIVKPSTGLWALLRVRSAPHPDFSATAGAAWRCGTSCEHVSLTQSSI